MLKAKSCQIANYAETKITIKLKLCKIVHCATVKIMPNY